MIEEIGIVREVSTKGIKIEIEATEHCASCKMCSKGEDSKRILYISPDKDYALGDKVMLKVSSKEVNKISFLIYILPLLDLFLGYYLGTLLNDTIKYEYLPIVFALSFFAASYIALYYLDKSYFKNKKKLLEVVKL